MHNYIQSPKDTKKGGFMKNYLLLSNGVSFEVNSKRKVANRIGKLEISEQFGTITLLPAKVFGEIDLGCDTIEFQMNSNDFPKIKNLVNDKHCIECKFISDDLNFDYHLSDLKNSICYY